MKKKVIMITCGIVFCVGVFVLASTFASAGMTKNIGKIAGQAASAAQQLLDINAATVEQLQQLPGIGEKIAKRIVKYREKNGPFTKAEDLLNVEGIGEKKLEKIKPLIQVKVPDEKKE